MLEMRAITDPADLPLIGKLAAEIWPDTYGAILTPEQLEYMMHMMYDTDVLEREFSDGIAFDVLRDDGEPIGFASYGPYRDGEMKLHKLYLSPARQLQGLGSLMLRHVIDRARALGYRTLRLNVNKHNARALAAYRRNGFEQSESVKADIGNGFFMDDYVMKRNL